MLSYYTFVWNVVIISKGILQLWLKKHFVGSGWPRPLSSKIESVHPRVQMEVCANFEEIPSKRSWDIAFTRMDDGQLENIMPFGHGCRRHQGIKTTTQYTQAPLQIGVRWRDVICSIFVRCYFLSLRCVKTKSAILPYLQMFTATVTLCHCLCFEK